ncbi:hypothetical protein ACMXYW_08040 [Neptuniibacter sp. QD48_55]|uniref:hypothetical protein n=1 Tax=Neptuniibacter sp. QD48_55 TaxID=3398212 RepID=UPI0039F59DB9
MNLEEYWNSYLKYCCSKTGKSPIPELQGIPLVVAPLVAAGHKINLPVESLSEFINKFREIEDVARRLTIRELEPDMIEKIGEEFQSGCTYSKEVIPKLFKKEEVAKQYHELMYPEKNA